MAVFARDDALVRTKRTWLLVAGLVGGVGGFFPSMLVLTSAIAGIGPVYLSVLAGLIPVAVMAGPMHAWNRWRREERGRLRADETGLWLDTRCIVRRASLRHGYVLRVEGRSVVRLGRLLRPVDVEIANSRRVRRCSRPCVSTQRGPSPCIR